DGVEEGADAAVRRRIPVFGGAVTVSGTGLAPGATATVLGETVRPDPSGAFVLERILPPGTYDVDVAVSGGGQAPVAIARQVEVPASEWFGTGALDLTLGVRREEDGDWEGFDRGRLSAYVEGRRADGIRVTASADTGEQPIRELFDELDERDPRQLLLRVDPRDLYPTYGDDSVFEDRTPTSGRVFARIERGDDFLQWGDFAGHIDGNRYAANARSLYGLQFGWGSEALTSDGDPRVRVLGYAASPERLPRRDVFVGTGGSVYFLRDQDVARATETVSVQLRDPDTDRVVATRALTPGEDYEINYVQGIVTLRRPLSSDVETGLLGLPSDDDLQAVLVAQYEITPAATDVDGMALGARAEFWATDGLRLGVSALREETATADQRIVGADMLYRFGRDSFVRADIARSDGPGFAEALSPDGGLTFGSEAATAGDGTAGRVEARLALGDLGLPGEGVLGGFYELREAGFSSLDVQTSEANGDETYWGLFADIAPREGLRFALSLDGYESDGGERDVDGSAEVALDLRPDLTLTLGLDLEDVDTASRSGRRTDLAARVDWATNDRITLSAFGQITLDTDGLPEDDRLGVGIAAELDGGWSVEAEVSDGDLGTAGRLLATQADAAGDERYLGWTLDPEREIAGFSPTGRDRGEFVAGGRRQLNDRARIFAENTYDLFGDYSSLVSAYGLDYEFTDTLRTTVTVEAGAVRDGLGTDLDRRAATFGLLYDTAEATASARVEWREETGDRQGDPIDSETVLLTARAEYRLDDERRLVFSVDHAETRTEDSPILDGDYTEVILGYAYRPVLDDRLNVLARYRYLDDQYGQREDGLDEDGPRQRSHVLSVDALYDLNRRWTLGGKLGVRLSETAAGEGLPYVENDAALAVLSARYRFNRRWDALIELRRFEAWDADFAETGVLLAGSRQINANLSLGAGFNFGSFSDDLTDLTRDDHGAFVNLVAQF
ncbi:MAG: hypothetical protein ACU0BS_06580, partial [Hasllibacter sp.]